VICCGASVLLIEIEFDALLMSIAKILGGFSIFLGQDLRTCFVDCNHESEEIMFQNGTSNRPSLKNGDRIILTNKRRMASVLGYAILEPEKDDDDFLASCGRTHFYSTICKPRV
jgi:hypothetical protein